MRLRAKSPVPNANRSKQVRKPASVALRIELCNIEPLIWRRIVVPATWPMSTLHNYVQWVTSCRSNTIPARVVVGMPFASAMFPLTKT
jgi:hypothetical protein